MITAVINLVFFVKAESFNSNSSGVAWTRTYAGTSGASSAIYTMSLKSGAKVSKNIANVSSAYGSAVVVVVSCLGQLLFALLGVAW